MKNRLEARRHSFRPGAMSIIQMGEELIGHPSTAINELVKNGYDADATLCSVYFYCSDRYEDSFAFIMDDGSGMDGDTLFGDWLKPSVSSKRKENAISDKFNRSLLGSKGIGRLAAMALGKSINVITRKDEHDNYSWISINRESFKGDVLLSEIDFPGDEIVDYCTLFSDENFAIERRSKVNDTLVKCLRSNRLDGFSRGTIIIVEALDESVIKILLEDFGKPELPNPEIEPYRVTRFYKALSTLITPINLNKDIQLELQREHLIDSVKLVASTESTFGVRFATNLLPEQNVEAIEWLDVEPILIQSVFDYRVFGKVSNNGAVSGIMSFNRIESKKHSEKFQLSPTESFERQGSIFENEDRGTGEYYFDIRVYDIGEKDNLDKLARLSKVGTAASFRSAFKEVQGLRISKNGFGVKPYGEEFEDWIELSKARVQNPGQNVNTNQILGYIFFFSPENDTLQEKTNREGFLENRAFQEVKNTLKNIFSNLGRRRYNFRLKNNLGRVPSSKHQRPDFAEFIKTLNDYNASSRVVRYTENFMSEVSTSLDNLEESLSFSERLASLGTGIELVYHEMAQPISSLRNVGASLEFKKDKISPESYDSFVEDVSAMHHSTDLLSELRGSLQPAIGRTRKKKFIPYITFCRVCNLYRSDIEEFKIDIIVDMKFRDYEINQLEYAFWIAFLNIVNNAIYWLKKIDGPRFLTIGREDERIIIGNSGPGISEDIIEDIFKYGVTTRQEKNATGLGLAFTQSVLNRNGWAVTAKNTNDGPIFILNPHDDE